MNGKALVCLVAFLCGAIPNGSARASALDQQARALSLLNAGCGTRVAIAQAADTPSPEPTATPTATPSPVPTASLAPLGSGITQLYATPTPAGNATAPPVPTPTPSPGASGAPIFVMRGGASPPPITPAGQAPPAPQAIPSDTPTLAPGMVAIISDQVVGNTKQGQPGDAIGNVHILYSNGELVGDRAHFDGLRTVTMTGHPFLINRAHDSVLSGDTIVFDTVDQTAVLSGGVGTSNEGVERGLVHFAAKELHTDPDGIGHGTQAFLSTCENARAGYHLTGKTLTYYPGDKIVINNVVMWLGAAAVFWLPRVVIPLRTVDDETRRPSFLPEMGYDQYEGFYVKMKLGFGKDQYYYGYYRVEYFTKVGLGLGYVGFYAKKNGRRTAQVNYYGIRNRQTMVTNHNLTFGEVENYSKTLKSTVDFSYISAYGAITNIPTSTSLKVGAFHTGAASTQTYTFQRQATGTQSSSDNFGVTDQRKLGKNIQQSETFTLTSSQNNYGGVESSLSSGRVTTLTTMSTAAANYQLTFDRSFTNTPSGIYKLPELQIRPTSFFKGFPVPLQASFTVGEYSEPANDFATQRAQLTFGAGPALYQIFGSSFQASATLNQYVYGTGDLKAAITQNMSLLTPIGKHVLNRITYSEGQYAGPAFVPFQSLDTLGTQNTKGANDNLQIFNQDYYLLSVGLNTLFTPVAQPITYQLSARPTARSVVSLGGSFQPGQGFSSTNVQLATPFGRDMMLQFTGDVDWKRQNGWLINKSVYLSKIIGDCYQIQLQYNQSAKTVNLTFNILAFPSHSLGLGIGGPVGSLIPSNFNSF